MTQRKKRFTSVFGGSITIISILLILTAGNAQAELLFATRDNNGTQLAFTSALLIRAIGGAGKLLSDVGVNIECTSVHAHGNVTTKTHGEATVVFLGCDVINDTNCVLLKKEIKALVEFDLKSADSNIWVVFSPEASSGGIFASYTLHEGEEECILIKAGSKEETLNLTAGEAGLVDQNAGIDKLLFSKTISELARTSGIITGLKCGSHKCWLDGEVEAEVLNASNVKIGTLEAHG